MAKVTDIPTFVDTRGELSVLERIVKFPIRRVYFIHHAEGLRGGHRHKKNIQFLVAVSGKVVIHVNNGHEKKDYLLDSPRKGLILETADWHTMADFSKDCILLVLASEPYDVNDYVDKPYLET
jgi:dTDP-4-dehydrorhamnose 3,5-epimerase-like enzyme